MKRYGAIPIGEAIKGYFAEMGFSDKMNEQRLLENLSDIAGTFIAKYITKKYISDKILYIHVSNSILRGELTMNKQSLIERLNASVSSDEMVIKDLVIR